MINMYHQLIGSKTTPLDNSPFPDNCSLDNGSPGQFPTTMAPGQFPPRRIAPWTTAPDNFHLGFLYCPQIITPGQLRSRATTITNYNFFMAIFYFFFMVQLYHFYFLL